MFYINIDNTEPNSEFYNGVLAHEFQHMIHWHQDKNETTWVNEGLSELAMQLNGYDTGGADLVFSQLPDTQLNAWSDDPNSRTEHYGASYLFMAYFLQRFGNEMTQAVVAEDANGIEGFNDVLEQRRPGSDLRRRLRRLGCRQLAGRSRPGRWPVWLPGPGSAADGADPPSPLSRPRARATSSQYATDYVELRGTGDLAIDFRGATTTRLASNEPYSGQYAWWANRVDDFDARLTRAFDLTAVDRRR